MKTVVSLFLLCAASLLCVIAFNSCTKQPAAPVPISTPAPIAQPNTTSCAGYVWKNRSKAPIGYIKGVAAVYARTKSNAAKPLGDVNHDALAWYGMKDGDLMLKTYTLLIGLGMRESSGNYGEGRDMSANNVQVDTAESGLFQFSYNLNAADPGLQKIYADYKAHPEKCLLDVFKEGIARSPSPNFFGSGEGLTFQHLARECPAFAVEYAALGIRVLRRHWGPVNRKEAEYRPECEAMLKAL